MYNEYPKISILAIDDEEDNIFIVNKIINDNLSQFCNCISFESSIKAWEFIYNNPLSVNVIILDQMMPFIDGIDFAKKVNNIDLLKGIPIIMQSGKIGIYNHQNALEAGAYYYLDKPFSPDKLLSMVEVIIQDILLKYELAEKIKHSQCPTEHNFEVSNFEEAKILVSKLSKLTHNHINSAISLLKLIENSIEHNILGIGYNKKLNLLEQRKYKAELNSLMNKKNSTQTVKVSWEKIGNKIKFIIGNEGQNFLWKNYLYYSEERICDINGRGISFANKNFLSLKYLTSGNNFECHCESVAA